MYSETLKKRLHSDHENELAHLAFTYGRLKGEQNLDLDTMEKFYIGKDATEQAIIYRASLEGHQQGKSVYEATQIKEQYEKQINDEIASLNERLDTIIRR